MSFYSSVLLNSNDSNKDLNSAKYNKKETLQINPVLSDIGNNVKEQSACQALSVTEISVELDKLQAFKCMKKKDWITFWYTLSDINFYKILLISASGNICYLSFSLYVLILSRNLFPSLLSTHFTIRIYNFHLFL